MFPYNVYLRKKLNIPMTILIIHSQIHPHLTLVWATIWLVLPLQTYQPYGHLSLSTVMACKHFGISHIFCYISIVYPLPCSQQHHGLIPTYLISCLTIIWWLTSNFLPFVWLTDVWKLLLSLENWKPLSLQVNSRQESGTLDLWEDCSVISSFWQIFSPLKVRSTVQ